jgi:hypothetical protein
MFLRVFIKNKKGSLIIESLVGISLVIVGMLAILNLMFFSEKKERELRHRLQAIYLSSEGIEVVKNIIDNNKAFKRDDIWRNTVNDLSGEAINFNTVNKILSSTTSVIYLFEDANGFYFSTIPLPNSTSTIFKRKIELAMTENDQAINVTSTVFWEENGQLLKVSLVDKFYLSWVNR